MRIFNSSGTLGDSYVVCCKLLGINEEIKIYHSTLHSNWNETIRKILEINPNIVDIEILNIESDICKPEYPYIHAHPKKYPDEPDDVVMNYFPNFEFKSNYNFDFSYIVLQPKSGREDQKREIPLKTIEKIINNSKYKVVLIGTSKKYEKIKNCINLINKTSLFDAFHLIKNSKYYIGFFGIMAMVALSHKINCNFIYISEEEIKKRVYGTPWERFCKNIISLENYKIQCFLNYKIKNKFISICYKILGERLINKINQLKNKIRNLSFAFFSN
ncbi:MAG: hypothetical protein ACTSPD_19825 [Promethearchaeota archaeon]